ncbi:MAG: protoporphyrinogen oxidase HemJ [Spirochaetia bacterium]|nr:protoporphyrinogen oxidase HemJ [Spirochaetia bacterium]
MGYLWIKAFHIIFMVAWFAGMFYIWRLFVYHAETSSEDVKKTLSVMENKLYKIIMTPAMLITVILGTWMLILRFDHFSGVYWIWIKITAVVFLIYLHFLSSQYKTRLQKGECFHSKKFRMMNEVPTLILFIAVILAILKPF